MTFVDKVERETESGHCHVYVYDLPTKNWEKKSKRGKKSKESGRTLTQLEFGMAGLTCWGGYNNRALYGDPYFIRNWI